MVGDSSGRLTIWNIRSRKLVHELQLEGEEPSSNAAITALEGSPAIDVVAVGSADGMIRIVNLKYDRVLFCLRQDRVPITSLTFRTDTGSEELPMLVSGGQDGQVSIHACMCIIFDMDLHTLTHAAPHSDICMGFEGSKASFDNTISS